MTIALLLGVSAAIYLNEYARDGRFIRFVRLAILNLAGVPCLNFFTGTHPDYHRPTDTADRVNYEDLDRVAELATAIVKRLMDASDAPQFTKVEQKTDTGGRAGLRIFTGTIPDYAADPTFQREMLTAPRRVFTADQLIAFARLHPAEFTPGTRFEWSNTNIVPGCSFSLRAT